MAKGMYAVVGGSTRKIKKQYAVIGGVTKKIKKMYAVVDGKTRLIFSSGGTLKYHGTLTDLSSARIRHVGMSFIGYAIFAGGISEHGTSYASYQADLYNSSLTHSTTSAGFGEYLCYASAATVGNYGLIAGGTQDIYGNSESVVSTVKYINTSLTISTTNPLTSAASHMASASIGNYALFVGGTNGSSYFDQAVAYSNTLTKSPMNLSTGRSYFAGGSNGTYAFFAGGRSSSGITSLVEAYGTNLTRYMDVTALSVARYGIQGAGVGDYVLIFGGNQNDSGTRTNIVEAYNNSLTRTFATSTTTYWDYGTVSLQNKYAIIAGGRGSSTAFVNTVNIYDESLTQTTNTLPTKTVSLVGATVSDYAIFAGGDQSGMYTYTASTEAFVIQE